ncbi:MAG: DUF47 family protein [archaeon]|nr:DUF47 family protein [archaeon]
MSKYDEKSLEKKSIDELTILFTKEILESNLKLVDAINFLLEDNFESYNKNLQFIIEAKTEILIKKTFESKIFKAKKSSFSKADRLKTISRINDMKQIGEYFAHKLLLYKVSFPDKEFKRNIKGINTSLKEISIKITDAVELIGSDLKEAHKIAGDIKEIRRKMREEEFQLLKNLWNYEVDYIGRTWYYLKELIEGIMMLADHINKIAEHIQFQTTKYIIFK